jgi:hypothetical protein
MVNLNKQVYDALCAISGVPVHYFYPDDWSVLPCISYYMLSNTEHDRADDLEYTSEVNYQIDVWAKDHTVSDSIALQVDAVLQTVGFTRAFAGDLFEAATEIFHKTMRYRKVASNEI